MNCKSKSIFTYIGFAKQKNAPLTLLGTIVEPLKDEQKNSLTVWKRQQELQQAEAEKVKNSAHQIPKKN